MSGLVVTAAGMVTAVGLDAPSSCAALRARLDGFAETRFLGPGGDWLVGASVPLKRQWIGQARLAQLLAGALAELRRRVPSVVDAALILCLPERDRPGCPLPDGPAFLARVAALLDLPGRGGSRIVAHGRPSGVVALERARRLIADGTADQVVIAGVDSYLTGTTIGHYLDSERLLSPATPDGFIPGEAAAAVLCRGDGDGLAIRGLGLGREAAHIFNRKGDDGFDLPLRADGMTQAYRRAFAEAGCAHSDIGIKMGDLIGETFWFKQSALAVQRTQRIRSAVHPIWPLAASLGNIGAAAVPVMTGWALAAKRKGYGGSQPILIEASGDDGACGALVVEAT